MCKTESITKEIALKTRLFIKIKRQYNCYMTAKQNIKCVTKQLPNMSNMHNKTSTKHERHSGWENYILSFNVI